MWNRQSNSEFDDCKGQPNQNALRQLVDDDQVPGLLAYDNGIAVGWVSLGPREVFSRLRRSRVTKPVDDVPVWAITCFVVSSRRRRTGVATELRAAAIEYARSQGAVAIEGYPVEPRTVAMPAIYAWMGLASMFAEAGFVELARRSAHRPVMRLMIEP